MEKDIYAGISLIAAIPSAIIALRTNKRLHKSLPDLQSYIWWHFCGVQLIFTSIVFMPMMVAATGRGDITAPVCIGFLIMLTIALVAGCFIVRGSKWGWVIGSLLSLNPLLWLINYFYYRRRVRDFDKFIAYKTGKVDETPLVSKPIEATQSLASSAQVSRTAEPKLAVNDGIPFYKKYKTGFFRLWLLLSVGWVGYIFYERNDEINYSFNYLMHHKSLVDEKRVSAVRQLEELEINEHQRVKEKNELDSRLQKLGIPVTKPKTNDMYSDEFMFKISKSRLESEIATPEPDKPDYRWILQMIVVPVVLPLALAAVILSIWKLGLWILAGFKQPIG